MSKIITNLAYSFLSQETGSEPLLLVQINFGGGLRYYCERELGPDEGIPCKGKVLSVSDFTYQKKADSFGASGNITLSLDDADGELHSIYNNTTLEQKPIGLFIYYPGTSLTHSVPLLFGRITAPITWSEGSRVATFSVETEVQSKEVGFSPTPTDFQSLGTNQQLDEEAYQVPWPMIFGKCTHVPAVKIIGRTRGFLKTDLHLTSDIYKISADKKFIEFTDKCDVESYIRSDPTDSDPDGDVVTVANKIYVEGGDIFPFQKNIKLIIDNIVFQGSFRNTNDKTEFTVEQGNVAKYNGVKVAQRGAVGDTEDPYKILWVADEKYQLAGLHCYFKGQSDWENLCIKQIGRKCYFADTFSDQTNGTLLLMDQKYSFDAYGTYRNGLHKDRNEQSLAAFSKMINRFTSSDDKQSLTNWAQDHFKKIASVGNAFLEIPANEEVRLWDEHQSDVYIASLTQLSSIDAVYARQTLKFADGKTRQSFIPLPKSWYTVNLESAYRPDGVTATTLQMTIPLLDRNNESGQWEDKLYITGTSTVGPNIVDAIQWILENYTDVGIDFISFAQVRASQNNYPANFMLNNKEDALKVAEDLAWQSRCVLIVDSGVAYLKFVAQEPEPVMVIDGDLIQLKSIEEGTTALNDVKTKLILDWYTSYQSSATPSKITGSKLKQFEAILAQILPEFNRKIDGLQIYTYSNNIESYGELEEERQVKIYNEEQYVQNTANFWGGRYSNIWRLVTLKSFLPALILQPFDCIILNSPGVSAYDGPAIVESVSYNHNAKDVTLELWLPVKAGFTTIAEEAWSE